MEKNKNEQKKKLRNKGKGKTSKFLFTKSSFNLNRKKPPSLTDFAHLANPQMSQPRSAKQLSPADISKIRFSRLRSKTVLNITGHLNLTKSGQILSKLKRIGSKTNVEESKSITKTRSIQRTPSFVSKVSHYKSLNKSKHPRNKSNPYLGIVARDL